jgi:hypothetical protein
VGATTYRLMAEFAANGEQGVNQLLTQLPKVVFSSTLTEPLPWANTRLVIPISASTWSSAAPSTEGSNCWSTCPSCSTVRRVPRERRADRAHRPKQPLMSYPD